MPVSFDSRQILFRKIRKNTIPNIFSNHEFNRTYNPNASCGISRQCLTGFPPAVSIRNAPFGPKFFFLRTGCTMDRNYYLAANKPSPPRFDALHTTDSRPSRVCRHALRTSGGESCAPILRPLLPTHELRPAGAHGRHGRGQGDARPAAGRHGLDRQQGRHAAGNDRQGGFLPYHGRLPLRPDFPRFGRPGGHLRGLQAVQKTLRKHRIPGTDRGQNGGRRTVDRAGRGRRAAGRHGLPGRHDGLQRGVVQNHGRRPFRGAAETAAGRRDQGQQDLRRRAGGQTGADRREKPLRLENLLRTHRPRSLGRPERAGLRGFQPRGKAPGGQHGRKGEGDGRRNQVEARLHPGRESGGHARREPRKGLLGSA